MVANIETKDNDHYPTRKEKKSTQMSIEEGEIRGTQNDTTASNSEKRMQTKDAIVDNPKQESIVSKYNPMSTINEYVVESEKKNMVRYSPSKKDNQFMPEQQVSSFTPDLQFQKQNIIESDKHVIKNALGSEKASPKLVNMNQ